MSFKGQSDRVAELNIRINKWYQLKGIHVYINISRNPNKEADQVYEHIDNILCNSWAHYNIVMGDFNAKVWPGQCMEYVLANMAWEKGTSEATC